MFVQPRTVLNQSTVVVSHRCMRHILHYLECVNVYRGADKSLARQEENKLQRQKILMFIYPIYYHNWRNISTIFI